MSARYSFPGVLGVLALLVCGAALADEPSGSTSKNGAGSAAVKKVPIEEIVVQARLPDPPVAIAPRPQIDTPRFVPPPLELSEPKAAPAPAASADRLAEADAKPKL